MGCFKRLEDFLQKPERVDSRDIQISKYLSDANLASLNNDPESKDVAGLESSRDRPIVAIQNANLGWDAETILKDINMNVAKGQHIAITGAVGSGKSLLLNAILGEVQPTAGSIHVGGIGISYCSQTAWLENRTARENAFRCVPHDEMWYQRVIDACALREFLGSQPPDETIGTSGARISGGEKQRLVRTGFISISTCRSLLTCVGFSSSNRNPTSSSTT